MKGIIADPKGVEIICKSQSECEDIRGKLINEGVYSTVSTNPINSKDWVIVIDYDKNELSSDEIAHVIGKISDKNG